MERFGISLNLKKVALTQYRNFDFNSMCNFNGVGIAFGEDGIFSLDDAETDAGTEIDSYVELPSTDFGALRAKRFRKLYVGYETSGMLKMSVSVDDETATDHTLKASKTDQKQHRGVLPMSRAAKGVYWKFIVENVDGCDFSIDNIEGQTMVLTKGRR